MLRTAFVLGAGMGTRLRPLTEVRCKPLVPVCNRPLIAYAFDHLLAHGFGRLVVNTHWLPEGYAREFPDRTYRRTPIFFRHEPDILETGGGIKNVEDLLGGETFLVYNGDILTDLPLAPAIREHVRSGNEVTMVLRSRGGPLQVALEAGSGRVADIGPQLHPEQAQRFLFTGLYVVSSAFLRRIPPSLKIGVIPIFRTMIREGAALGGVVIDDGQWWDLGSREQYLAVHRHLALGSAARGRSNGEDPQVSPWIAAGAEVASGVQLTGAVAIGPCATVGAGACLHDTIVWPGAQILAGSALAGCVVTGRAAVSGHHAQEDL